MAGASSSSNCRGLHANRQVIISTTTAGGEGVGGAGRVSTTGIRHSIPSSFLCTGIFEPGIFARGVGMTPVEKDCNRWEGTL